MKICTRNAIEKSPFKKMPSVLTYEIFKYAKEDMPQIKRVCKDFYRIYTQRHLKTISEISICLRESDCLNEKLLNQKVAYLKNKLTHAKEFTLTIDYFHEQENIKLMITSLNQLIHKIKKLRLPNITTLLLTRNIFPNKNICYLSNENLIDLAKIFPNLKTLDFDSDTPKKAIETICKHWEKLEQLGVLTLEKEQLQTLENCKQSLQGLKFKNASDLVELNNTIIKSSHLTWASDSEKTLKMRPEEIILYLEKNKHFDLIEDIILQLLDLSDIKKLDKINWGKFSKLNAISIKPYNVAILRQLQEWDNFVALIDKLPNTIKEFEILETLKPLEKTYWQYAFTLEEIGYIVTHFKQLKCIRNASFNEEKHPRGELLRTIKEKGVFFDFSHITESGKYSFCPLNYDAKIVNIYETHPHNIQLSDILTKFQKANYVNIVKKLDHSAFKEFMRKINKQINCIIFHIEQDFDPTKIKDEIAYEYKQERGKLAKKLGEIQNIYAKTHLASSKKKLFLEINKLKSEIAILKDKETKRFLPLIVTKNKK